MKRIPIHIRGGESRSGRIRPKERLPLILASASPRRRSLLEEHGYEFTVEVAGVAEVAPPHLSPGEIVFCNARAKARAVAERRPDALVLGVDTVVVFEDEIFGKPANLAAAESMLRRLNGRSHEVYSGVWLAHLNGSRERGFTEITRVRFRRRSAAQLQAYLARIGPLDKAGAYAAQDDRGEIIAAVEGSFTNVVGLPMERLERELRAFWGGMLARSVKAPSTARAT
jgi:septum formation protein